MRVAPSRRPTPPPSPPEGPIGSSVEYDEYHPSIVGSLICVLSLKLRYIARAYQDRYEAEHARSIEVYIFLILFLHLLVLLALIFSSSFLLFLFFYVTGACRQQR